MSDRDNSPGDEEQSATMPMDYYRALLAVTCPLVVAERTLPPWRGGQVCRSGFGILSEPGHWCPEFVLRRGEISGSGESDHEVAEDEDLATTSEEAGPSPTPEVQDARAGSTSTPRRSASNLQIRICIGMS